MSAKLAARVVAAVLLGVVLFQIAVALGAPFGRFTQGGQTDGALPMTGRSVAALSAAILAIMGAAVLALVGEGPMRAWRRGMIRSIAWFVVAYALIGTAMNLASPSRAERPWAIATVIVFAGTVGALRRTAPARPSEPEARP